MCGSYIPLRGRRPFGRYIRSPLLNATFRRSAVHINRLTSLQFQMRYILYKLYAGTNDAFNNSLWGFYTDERDRMAYEAQMARGKFEPVATISEKHISAVLKTPWATDGKNFSQRLWTNREQLVGTLQAELTRALITGADSASVAKTIAQKMNAAEYAASRLVQTEITRIITESDKDTFAEMGIDEVEIVGTLDGHTCGTCGDMDGKHMPRTEAHAGTTAPPFHPNCRCVIVPYFDDDEGGVRVMRDPETGKSKIVEDMTFNEWKEKYGSKKAPAQNAAPKAERKAASSMQNLKPVEAAKTAKASSDAAISDIILSKLGIVVMDSRKFTEYALNPAKDPDKAKAFMLALGYDLSNWQELEEKVAAAIKTSRARQKRETEYGIQYESILQITGANGKTANVTTGWIKSEDSEEVRMTTVYVSERKAKNES